MSDAGMQDAGSTAGSTRDVGCPHCGTRNPAGSYFCNRCGTALAADLSPRDPAAPVAASDPFDATLSEGPPRAVDVDPNASAERAVDSVDEPTLDALTTAYQPPAVEEGDARRVAEPVLFPDEQLLGGGAGYLELVSISGEMVAPPTDDRLPVVAETEHWRIVRTLLRDEPALATAGGGAAARLSYRPLWAVLLLLGVALLGLALPPGLWSGSPQTQAGARPAFNALEALQTGDDVLVIWGADPGTAAEMNSVALPVVSHLLEVDARSIVVGLRPASLAHARRVYAEAVRGLDESAMRSVLDNWVGSGLFLPGGQLAMALVAGDLQRALNFEPARAPAPRLVLVVAANPNDVQEWLEAGWPRLRIPTVAVSTATADPLLRPYIQSGQLDGLVAGFDGALTYQALRENALAPDAALRLTRIANAQNLGALALLLVLFAGNVFTFFGRSRRA